MSALTVLVILLERLCVDRECERHRKRPAWLWPLCPTCRQYHLYGRSEWFWR